VNDFDRVTCMTLLDFFMRDSLLEDGTELFPFLEPQAKPSFTTISATSRQKYLLHIEEKMARETPIAYGLHPNAETYFRSARSENLVRQLQLLQPDDTAGTSGTISATEHMADTVLIEILDRFGERTFDIQSIEDEFPDGKGPYQNIFVQECQILNTLLEEIRRSLDELNQGFAGELTMSDNMELLMRCLFRDQVPSTWERLAWPSMRSLSGWLNDLDNRIVQLQQWTERPIDIPRSTWLGGLKNPQSFLTAIKQVTAQSNRLELDKLSIQTEITKIMNADELEGEAKQGAYVHGFFIEGARWDIASMVVQQSRPKELFCQMPIIQCRALQVERTETSSYYSAPVYKTRFRGPTYIFSAQLKTKSPPARWVLASVALILDPS